MYTLQLHFFPPPFVLLQHEYLDKVLNATQQDLLVNLKLFFSVGVALVNCFVSFLKEIVTEVLFTPQLTSISPIPSLIRDQGRIYKTPPSLPHKTL